MEVDHKLLTDSMAPPTDELLRYWSLTIEDLRFVSSISTLPNLRVWVGLQICFLKKRGALARYPSDFPADAIPWMNRQFSVSPLSQLQAPHRPATWSQQREALVTYLGWREFEDCDQDVLGFIHGHVLNGKSRTEIINDLPKFLHRSHIVKPASQAELERHAGHLIERSTLDLEILINRSLGTDLCIQLETIITGKFELNPAILDELMRTIPMPSRKNFKNLVTIEKAIRPIARLCREGTQILSRKLIEENAESVRRWSIWEVKRFSAQKRHMVLACFIIDAHSKLLDSLVHMFDRLVNNREAKLEKSWYQVIIRQQEKSRDNRRLILRAAELFANSKPEELLASHSAFDLGSLRKALDDKSSRLDNDEDGKAQIICGLARKFRSILRLFLELDPHISESYKTLAQALRLAGDLKGSIVPSEYPNFIDKKFRQTAHSPCGNWRRDLWEWFLVLELKTRLRSQDVYFPESIRSRGFWQVVGGSKTPEPGGAAFQAKVPAVEGLLKEFNNEFNLFRESLIENRFVKIDKGELRLSRDPANATTVPAQVMARIRNGLGRIRIEDLFREIDAATNFSGAFRHHATGEELSSSRRHALHATLIAHATNLGLSAMASAAEGVSAEMLENVARGYHSNDCLREAMRRVIDYQASLEAGNRWGIGDISSSDGQLFGVRGKSLAAEYHPRRFGWLKRGVNVYSHISDRYTVFSSQVLSCSVREWIAVLDGLMENDTVLRPKIHTTDTHGYTDHMFALSFLLGFTFAPRIKDAGGTRLWLPEGFDPGDLESIFQHKKISLHELSENWDQIQRIISALKQKLIDGRTLCMRLANSPTDPVSSALLSAGRIIKTTFLLRWMRDHSFRLALHAQLNKGESRQELARNVNFASGSGLRSADHNDLMHRTSALALVCNIIVAWNTKAIGQLIDEMRAEKTTHSDLDFSSISPLLHSHIIRTGTYVFRQEGAHVGTH